MMISPSSFSLVALHLRKLLADGIDDIDEGNITISNPKDRLRYEGKNSINLFFYKMDYGGFPSDSGIENPLFVRLYCLITAYGIDITEDNNGNDSILIPHGENDLKLIGGVMSVLHYNPVFQVSYDGGVIQFQAVIQQLSLDDINHIWSTQGDVPYRISMAYEFALAPVPLAEIKETSQMVGATGVGVVSNTNKSVLPDKGYELNTASPQVEKIEVNISIPEWEPHICFVDQQNALSYVLGLPHTSAVDKRNLQIIVAGKQESTVKIKWEIWQPWDSNSKQGGWSKPEDDKKHAEFLLPKNKQQSKTNILDPLNINDELKVAIELPIELPITVATPDDRQKKARRQAIVYVIQEWKKNEGTDKEQKISVRSNPLLVSVYFKENGE